MLGLGTLATTVPIKASLSKPPDPKEVIEPEASPKKVSEPDGSSELIKFTSENGELLLHVYKGSLSYTLNRPVHITGYSEYAPYVAGPIEVEVAGDIWTTTGEWDVIKLPFMFEYKGKTFGPCHYTQLDYSLTAGQFSLSFICEG